MAAMRPNPFLRFHRAAEAAGYPALLIIAMVSLAMVVAAVALLGMVGGVPAFSFAILSLVAALALLSGEIEAALSDVEDPPTGRQADQSASSKRPPTLS